MFMSRVPAADGEVPFDGLTGGQPLMVVPEIIQKVKDRWQRRVAAFSGWKKNIA